MLCWCCAEIVCIKMFVTIIYQIIIMTKLRIISRDSKKAFSKIQHPFRLKNMLSIEIIEPLFVR